MLTRHIDDLERRLRIMEATQRSGLGSIEIENGSAGFTMATSPLSQTSWQNGSGVCPEITMTTGSRVIILAQARAYNYGQDVVGADLRCESVHLGVGIDSTLPHEFPSAPQMRNALQNVAYGSGADVAVYGIANLILMTTREDLAPGEHTFKLLFAATDDYPAGTMLPVISDTSLIVIPLGYS